MSITSYAQNFEDVMLWRALGHIERGMYIDIGAQDPVVDSVSLAFHERGWQGIHVEPTPHYADLLRQQRPGDTVIQAAAGHGPAVLRFFEIADTGISTADAGIAAGHRERGFDVHEITVPCVPLSAILEACVAPEIHWMKIDVEGFEQQVLSSWGAVAARPWIVVVESTLPLTQIETYESWEPILIAHGYDPVYFDGLNRYYVSQAHPEIKVAFLSPPNVFDGFVLNGTASATFHHLIKARCDEKINALHQQTQQQQQGANDEIGRLALRIAELGDAHAAQEKSRAEREQALTEQASQTRQELEAQLRNQLQREQALSEQTGLAGKALENQLRTQVRREQEVVVQLLASQQQAAQEMAEQFRSHSEYERALQSQHALREQALHAQLQSGQQELRRQDQDATQREKEFSEQRSQTRQTLESVLCNQVQREQDVSAQLLSIRQQVEQEKIEQTLQYAEQADVFQRRHAELEQALTQQRQAEQKENGQREQAGAQREVVLASEVAGLQHEVQVLHATRQLQDHQHDAELGTRMVEHKRLMAACSDAEEQLKAELLLEQQTSLRLHQSLVYVQQSLATTHASFTWRMTAPLRALAAFIAPNNTTPVSPTIDEAMVVRAIMPVASEITSTDIQHPSIESSMLPSAQPSTPILASTLAALLACHDQHFIRCAYQTLLNRAPDPEGLGYYLARLRLGFSKIQILAQLRLSGEGQANAAQVSGLDAAIKNHQQGRYPLIGWVLRRINGWEGNHPTERKLRGIENQIFVLGDESNRRFNQLESALTGLQQLVVQQTQVTVASMGSAGLCIPDIAKIAVVQSPEPDGLKQLSAHTRGIYFQLKAAVVAHAGRAE
jgi:FkbM family methyltransferase